MSGSSLLKNSIAIKVFEVNAEGSFRALPILMAVEPL